MKLLLDEHIWPGVADMVRAAVPKAVVESIHRHDYGLLVNRPDSVILNHARQGGWILVTFDVNSIPRLLAEMARCREDHAGVVFVSSKSFAQNDHGGLARALARLLRQPQHGGWKSRTAYLSKKEAP